jgi:hypothetical protein
MPFFRPRLTVRDSAGIRLVPRFNLRGRRVVIFFGQSPDPSISQLPHGLRGPLNFVVSRGLVKPVGAGIAMIGGPTVIGSPTVAVRRHGFQRFFKKR